MAEELELKKKGRTAKKVNLEPAVEEEKVEGRIVVRAFDDYDEDGSPLEEVKEVKPVKAEVKVDTEKPAKKDNSAEIEKVRKIIAGTENPVIKDFWTKELNRLL